MAEMAVFLLSALVHAQGIARERKIDGTIAFFTLPSGIVGLRLKKALGIPYVISLRGGDVPGHVPQMGLAHRVTAPVRRMVLSEAQAIAANSSSLAGLSRKSDPFAVAVIPNGVDTGYFRPEFRKNNAFTILFVGRLHAEKNLPFLITQLDRLSRETALPFELHLAGDGPDRDNILAAMKASGIRDRIFLHGWCDQETVRRLYGQTDCVVNPSLYEGLSNSCLEAMSCGLPVVASRVPGNNDLIAHGDTGFLFDLDNPDQFRDTVRRLMESPDMCSTTGQNARSFVEKSYSWKAAALRYIESFPES
jgi:glycosyltransferase involved in cell wall biosynthesis